MFKEEVVTGIETIQIQQWINQALPPTNHINNLLYQSKPPHVQIDLAHVYGIATKCYRDIIKIANGGSTLIFFAAKVGIVMDTSSKKQKFF